MSLELNSDNDYAARTGEANLGTVDSASVVCWYYRNDATANDIVLTMSKSGTTGAFRTVSATHMRARAGGSGNTIDFAANSGEWIGLAITMSTTGLYTYYTYQAGALTQQYQFNTTDLDNIVSLTIGQDGGTFNSARGSYRYLRYWADRVLDATELEAEFEMTPSSGTPAANLTNLYLSWALPDGTDTTDLTGNSRVPTISGAVTSAEEPTIGGSSIPIAAIASMNRRGAEWF